MATSDDSRDTDATDIDRAFAVRAALTDAWPTGERKLSVSTFASRLLSVSPSLLPEEWQLIKSDGKLNASWQLIRRALTVAELPRQAAASDGILRPRQFAEGSVTVVPSRKPGLMLVKVIWTPPDRLPRLLLLEGAADMMASRTLGRLRPSGDFMIACDESSPEDQAYLRLLRDPRTTGTFLS